jgi:hypothetical protein
MPVGSNDPVPLAQPGDPRPEKLMVAASAGLPWLVQRTPGRTPAIPGHKKQDEKRQVLRVFAAFRASVFSGMGDESVTVQKSRSTCFSSCPRGAKQI